MRLVHEDSHHKLAITSARLSDAGQYTVVARNEAGTRSCSMCRVRVVGEHEIERSSGRESRATEFAPVVLEALHESPAPLLAANGPGQNQVVSNGSGLGVGVQLTCAVLANPPPTTFWLFRARPLRYSERVLPEFRPPPCFCLRISEPTAADSGLYSLVVSNKHGMPVRGKCKYLAFVHFIMYYT